MPSWITYALIAAVAAGFIMGRLHAEATVIKRLQWRIEHLQRALWRGRCENHRRRIKEAKETVDGINQVSYEGDDA